MSKDGADWVAAHLAAAVGLADDEPETAWRHARAARARGGRIGVVRETVGLVAYRAGEWAEAIGELRAARRMGGGPGHLAVMADCERALGHPERAIEMSRSTQAEQLDPAAATELTIVVAGARADLGQVDAALAQLEQNGLDKADGHPRLAYAHADLLLKAGRKQDAQTWFIRAANADVDEETDALERIEEITSGGLDDLDQSEDINPDGTDAGSDLTGAEAEGTRDETTDAGVGAGTAADHDSGPAADGSVAESVGDKIDVESAAIAGTGTESVEFVPAVVNADEPDPGRLDVSSAVNRADGSDGEASEVGADNAVLDAEVLDAETSDTVSTVADDISDSGVPTLLFSHTSQAGDR